MAQTLQEFIDSCVAEVARRDADEQARRDAAEQQRQQLLQAVRVSLRTRVAQAIPQPLRQFTDYTGNPTLEELRGYPNTWTPSVFSVAAPGLKPINFTTTADGPDSLLRITDISVIDPAAGSVSFGTDWIKAVAAAVI